MKKLTFLTLITLTSCHHFIYEKEAIVTKIESADNYKGYKFKVFVESFPADQILWTTKQYNVGDTIVFCKK